MKKNHLPGFNAEMSLRETSHRFAERPSAGAGHRGSVEAAGCVGFWLPNGDWGWDCSGKIAKGPPWRLV